MKHIVVDTSQHFSDNVSKIFIDELDIKIHYYLCSDNQNQLYFMSDAIKKLSYIYDKEKPDLVLVLGDTNSTLVAALVANKKSIKLGHIEAGIRCEQRTRPGPFIIMNTGDHGFESKSKKIRDQNYKKGTIIIGNDVWIAARVTILRGSTIPDGCVIGADSLITRHNKLESYGVYMGNPLIKIKERK